uniref:Outer membrane protein porin n=1 Tax=Tanacetum cinerariifolium TaxID=118510 RepID=A0A6L2LVA6_TANCI|nr:outer membrane protein porin [Tanacetum cinerariifolium]
MNQKLLNLRECGKENLQQRDEKISTLRKKLRLLEEQSQDLILSLQTQLKETVELVIRFSDERYFALKENESLKVEIKSLQTENTVLKSAKSEFSEKIDQMKSHVSELSEKLHILDQEMKQKTILFEEDKRMFLAKNEFLEKVFSSVSKEYNDLLASNDILRQSLETKFNLLQHDLFIEQTIETIKKEMRDTVQRFDANKKVFENKILKLEKILGQRVKDFDKVKTELSKRTDKFETYFANLEKENSLLKLKLASQNYTSLQKENNDLRTSYNELKEKYETSCEKLEKENSDLKMHYKRLFDSINQKNVVSQVFTNSSPKVNVSEKIFTENLQNRFRKRFLNLVLILCKKIGSI